MENGSRVPCAVRVIEPGRTESLALLAGVPVGRVGFARQALAVIRPVNHLVDGDSIVIRTHADSALLSSACVDEVVVYEADQLDITTRTGWSVMVTGRAARITAPLDVVRDQQLLIPWMGMGMGMGVGVDHVVRICAELVTGYRLPR